ncbi:preprotein translocase subunit YajC [Corynebacterium lizhenjunii]|uniref:Preprotein translocase subunit YajC n=1 Tax=Corynebacterium lizhenjunii TaxID=2709394 RepID=A0A7T0KD21_9CORY|nr:preprotein translocase subunit YajC [Corynebacterium lizhenjunii]QPK78239.1 preprotein translocase subunit YajC [Corynebacterium lizhenjunii]
MDGLILIAILAVLFLPYFFLMRKQRAAQKKVLDFQASLHPGQRVVTAGGFHATVVGLDTLCAQLEIAPGVVATVERTAIIRPEEEAQAAEAEDPGRPEGHREDL